MAPSQRIDVGVLGATGMVGQQFISLLASHPWFKPSWLAASERSEGKTYREAASWRLPEDPPASIGDVKVEACVPGRGPQLIFSALDANAAKDIEPEFARAGHTVITNARSFRMDPAVPLLIPEINGDHLALTRLQQKAHGWSGVIVTNPNCSTVALAMVLAPLRRFGLSAVNVTTLQAVSGAGYPGVPSMDIIGNVVPFISGEEEKMQSETQKILGALEGDAVIPHRGRGQRAHDPGAGDRRSYADGLDQARSGAVARGSPLDPERLAGATAGARAAECAALARWSASSSRIARSLAAMRCATAG